MATSQIVISGDASQLKKDFEAMAKSAAAIGKSLGEALAQGENPANKIRAQVEQAQKAAEALRAGMAKAKEDFRKLGSETLKLSGDELEKFVSERTEAFRDKAQQSFDEAMDKIKEMTGRSDTALEALRASLDEIARKLAEQSDLEKWFEDLKQNMAATADKKEKNFNTTVLPEQLEKASDAFTSMFTDIALGSKSSSEAFAAFGDSIKKIALEIVASLAKVFMMKALFGSVGGGGFFGGGLVGSLGNWLGGLSNNAKGNVFTSPALAAYSNSIVANPTIFPFARGGAFRLGLMGEAGAEAIMPLTRTQTGDLGVRVDLGGNRGSENNFYFSAPITVEYTAKEDSTPDTDGQKIAESIGIQLRKELTAFVRQELITQTRPGGLLNAGIGA